MGIWFDRFDIEYANQQNHGCVVGALGIAFTEATEESVTAQMPVDQRTKQPAGVLHGGSSVMLAETVATWAATFSVDRTKYHCVGIEINANHVRAASEGFVFGTGRPLHLGRSTQVWEVKIVDDRQRLICVSRMTAAVLKLPSGY